MMALRAARTSEMLCGGILVATLTAIPLAPFTNKWGKRAGRTVGSSCGREHHLMQQTDATHHPY